MVTDHKLQESDLDAKAVHGDGDGGLQQQLTSSVVSELTNGNLNAVDTAKMLDTLSLSTEHDLSSVHAYKKLLEGVGKRTDTISRLGLEIQFNEKRKSTLRPKKKPVEVKTENLLT